MYLDSHSFTNPSSTSQLCKACGCKNALAPLHSGTIVLTLKFGHTVQWNLKAKICNRKMSKIIKIGVFGPTVQQSSIAEQANAFIVAGRFTCGAVMSGINYCIGTFFT